MVAAENGAINGAKVGGVADVIRDIPIALANRGISVDVIIPNHNQYHHKYPSEQIAQLNVAFRGESTPVSLYELFLPDSTAQVRQFVIDHPSFREQGGKVYIHDADGAPFASDANKFALSNLAIAEFLLKEVLATPDAVHLHDWHASFLAVLLAFDARYKEISTIQRVYSVHNLSLQGIRPLANDESSLEAWYPQLAYDGAALCDPRYPHCINPMRAGIVLSDKVHLVSPTYCLEVLKPTDLQSGFIGGEGLQQDLNNKYQHGDMVGILNGCDYEQVPPVIYDTCAFLTQTQQAIMGFASQNISVCSSHFVANERVNQWLKQPSLQGPIITSVGRLTSQKMSLLLERHQGEIVISQLLKQLEADTGGHFILIGSGDQSIALALTQVMAQHNNFLFINGYDELLSNSLYSLGDLFLMPSSFEPCGISQMLAMKAGQPCIVNGVGGLIDTVKHNENGFVFSGNSIEEKVAGLIEQFNFALTLYSQSPNQYASICQQAAKCRFSWDKSAGQYIEHLYC